MSLLDSLRHAWPPGEWAETTILAAVSGGADSIALLRGLHTLKMAAGGRGRIVVAHFNHRLRGAESDADESFVQQLAERLEVDCVTDPIVRSEGEARGLSEDSARRARYEFLERAAMQRGARFIATAHTADDQAETILHRILRGTGIDGLAGIPRAREIIPGVTLIRPLRKVWRAEIVRYLDQLGQPFRNDSSNLSLTFTRNRLRHALIPLLERDFNPRIRESLCRLGRLADEVNQLVDGRVQQLLARVRYLQARNECSIDCDAIRDEEPYIRRQLMIRIWECQEWPLRDMTFDKWNELADMTCPGAACVKAVFPGDIAVERVDRQVVMRRPAASSPALDPPGPDR